MVRAQLVIVFDSDFGLIATRSKSFLLYTHVDHRARTPAQLICTKHSIVSSDPNAKPRMYIARSVLRDK